MQRSARPLQLGYLLIRVRMRLHNQHSRRKLPEGELCADGWQQLHCCQQIIWRYELCAACPVEEAVHVRKRHHPARLVDARRQEVYKLQHGVHIRRRIRMLAALPVSLACGAEAGYPKGHPHNHLQQSDAPLTARTPMALSVARHDSQEEGFPKPR